NNKKQVIPVQDENIIKQWTWERYKRTERDLDDIYKKLERKVDAKVWDAEKRIIVIDDVSLQLSHQINRRKYNPDERIRVVIIFQVASFWPSIEYLYHELTQDERFEAIIMCYDEAIDPSIKTETAREFLDVNQIPYTDWTEFSMRDYKPHIVFLQIPYDSNRRREFKSNYLKSAGYRVAYVPYGMEIGDTQHSRKQQLNHIVRRYAWMIFTFSETMHKDYRLYSEYDDNVYVTGLPKFDSLYNKDNFPLNNEIVEKANGRKIILWKVHFPKLALVNNKMELFTPRIEEYIRFLDYVRKDTGNFYVFMPHPRFLEFNEDANIQKQLSELMSNVRSINNIYVDDNDDYRNSLLHADAIIVDRSSIMVEAAAVGVPVLFMYNDKFAEPMTQAIKPLIDSYYQGTTVQDMINFITMIESGSDTKKNMRELAFQNCIPYFDGNCSKRIVKNIIKKLGEEA
ncbi:MAG: CDP-glycerol glycerophosphotransferase family protein, partial [Tannerellaceae bacterium]|nr:CDP-glycerol glycerophosphotransferase family protein [Tannerellaceae bacterium]